VGPESSPCYAPPGSAWWCAPETKSQQAADHRVDRSIPIGEGYVESRTLVSDQPSENTNGFALKRDTTRVSAFDETGEWVGDLVRVPGDESLESVTVLEGGLVQTRQGTRPLFRGAHFGARAGRSWGDLFGVLVTPARRATSLHPVEALGSE
jgi:hypothetical protein